MADPVSITSLVLEIGHVVSSLIRYAKDLRGARSEPRKLTEELFALKGILEHLHPSAQQFEEKKPPPPPYRPNTALDPSTLDNVLRSTSEFLHTLLTELEEPETRFKGLKQRLEWPFTQKEFNAHLTRLERVKSWLILGMVADNAALDRDLYREMENLASCMKEDLYLRGQERMKSANRDLVGWLAPVEPGNAHLKASKRTEIGTGRWFIDGYFKDWLRGDEDAVKIVFLMGKSGTGKTTVFAQTVEELTSMSLRRAGLSFAYFYCTFSDTASQDPVNVLGSLVVQLSSTMPEILNDIRPIYEEIPRSQTHRYPIDIAALEDAIITHSSGKTRVVLLVDAINESPHTERIKSSLLRLAGLSTNLRILVTSTTNMVSPNHVKVVNMSAESIQDDIEAFIYYRLGLDETLRNLSSVQKDEIRSTLTNDADGSFRWVQLSLDNLSAQRTARSIREALHKLPGTLRETYASILDRISPPDWRFVRRALFWLSFAYRPLKIDELNEAVVIDGSTSVLGDDMRLVSPQILLQISQGLITQDKSGNVSLAHSSVRDFLASDWIRSSRVRGFGLDPSKADTIIMRQCLAYLCLDNFRSGYVSSTRLALKRIQDHPFLKYAAQLWALHAETCVFGTRDWHLLSRFFNSRRLPRRGNFGVWVQALIPNVEISNIDVTEPLYYAASFGLVPVVRAILASDPDIDVDAPGGRTGATALFIACFRRSYEVVDMLVLAGADVDFVDKDSHCSVRKLAARDGHVFPYRKRKGIDSLSYVNN